MSDTEARIGRIAVAQHGLITSKQAQALGLSSRQIGYRVQIGRWDRMARGTYRIAGTQTSWRQTTAAACLLRPGTVASHLTAAALAGVGPAPPPKPQVIVPVAASNRNPLATVHRSDLDPSEVTSFLGIPATTVARTLVDCSSTLGRLRLRPLVDEAMHGHLATTREIDAILFTRSRVHRARTETLVELLEPWRDHIAPGSPAEARLLRLLVDWGFPAPDRQVPILDRSGATIARVDVGWPERGVGIEYDSTRWHGPPSWSSDERRHALIVELGWTLLRAEAPDLRPGARLLLGRLRAAWVATDHLVGASRSRAS